MSMDTSQTSVSVASGADGSSEAPDFYFDVADRFINARGLAAPPNTVDGIWLFQRCAVS